MGLVQRSLILFQVISLPVGAAESMSVVDGGGVDGVPGGAGAGGQGTGAAVVIVSRTRRRLDQEKARCMQRYEAREQRVLKTLNYCVTALERLESWAVFAIFPIDEIRTGDRCLSPKVVCNILVVSSENNCP